MSDLRKLLAEARAYVEGAVTERENDGPERRPCQCDRHGKSEECAP